MKSLIQSINEAKSEIISTKGLTKAELRAIGIRIDKKFNNDYDEWEGIMCAMYGLDITFDIANCHEAQYEKRDMRAMKDWYMDYTIDNTTIAGKKGTIFYDDYAYTWSLITPTCAKQRNKSANGISISLKWKK